MEPTKSQRIIRVLLQLEQFTSGDSQPWDTAIHMLSGATVAANPEDFEENGLLIVQFPGGPPIDVIGDIYLKLQLAESAAHELHLDADSGNPIAIRSAELHEHFVRKYDL